MAYFVALRRVDIPRWVRPLAQFLATAIVLSLLTCAGFYLHGNQLTIGLLYLLVVVAVASRFGFRQATLASIVAGLLLDYYFEPPIFSFEVAGPGIFVALATFEVTALAISRHHGREMRIAREAALQREGMEQLYELSRSTMLLDLRQPPGPQLAILIHRIFDLSAVAIFDFGLGRQDRVGDWKSEEENLAKECYLRGARQDYPLTDTSERILQSGSTIVGALVIRKKLSPLVVDALASLAVITIDRHQAFEKEDRAETARISEQLRSAVMDALAHELKTPITAIQTASSGLLELGRLPDAQASLVMLIDERINHLNTLCTRLLRTSKLEPKRTDLARCNASVFELISEVLTSQSVDAKKDHIQITLEDRSLTVRADRDVVGMILAQYVDNARKYSASGTPIEIAARKTNSEVLISVHNFGSFIRIEDRERIFERFYRAPDMRDAVPGTGIGLSVARKAAEAHHGHVWAISGEKEGTTFFLSLPAGARS